jgi:putative FmdB family regulatory protein
LPLYEYECPKDGIFELVRKFSDPPLAACPTCAGPIEKLVSAPAIQFKGTGWYITDYARKSTGGEAAGNKDAGSKDKSSKDGGGKDAAKKDGGSSEKGSSDSAKPTASSSSTTESKSTSSTSGSDKKK